MSQESPPGGPRRLRKSHDQKLGGVAAGIAEYFGTDPTLIRVLFVIGLFIGPFGGAVLVAYIAMWFIMPDPEGAAPPQVASGDGGGTDPTLVLGIVLLAIGALLLLRTSWVWTSWFGWGAGAFPWPALLIALGAFIIFRAQNRT